MDFGPVVVSNVSIKDKLLVTQRDLVTRLLKLLQTAPKDAMAAANKRYKELQVQFSLFGNLPLDWLSNRCSLPVKGPLIGIRQHIEE